MGLGSLKTWSRERLLERVQQLIEQGQAVLTTRRIETFDFVDEGKMAGFRSAALSFIERVYGRSHTHYEELAGGAQGWRLRDVERIIAILDAVQDEIAGDWLFTIQGLVTAEVFADFIEMVDYLVGEGYKDAAAVIAGSTLEEHLRQLCQKHGIKTVDGGKPKKADRLNADLAGAQVYTKLDQKTATAWLDLRNKAAHGHYDAYNQEQVKGMITGITEFMARISV